MKNFLLLSLSIVLTATSLKAQLYIGGVIDAGLPGGLPKGVQFCANADIPDLSIYGFGSANNGGGSDGEEHTFAAEAISAGDCFWIASETTQFTAFFGFAPCDTDGAANINGDDAIELFMNGAVIDLYGDINTIGDGESWDYTDGWAVAADAVASPTYSAGDWTFSGINELDGETSNATATNPYPSPAQVCPAVLPVTLTSFEGLLSNKNISLNWQTAQELNNSHFEVQHSTDNRTFTTLDKVVGAGTTYETVDYSFTDENPANGINYYRLQQFDFDGQSEYSQVVSVRFGKETNISIYPNPVQGVATIALDEEFGTNSTAEIISQNGSIVSSQTFTTKSFTQTISVVDLSPGIYVLRVVNGNEVYTERFVKK